MNIQKSFESHDTGVLYIVPTPIGNLEDITYRALKVLKTVDVIAAEDTRNTMKLLNHFDIKTSMMSYHEHNKHAREDGLLKRLDNKESIAVVSDAGMPGVSDPGFEIVKAATARDYPVIVLPGASAGLCALVGSGLPTDEFLFYGFLPRKKREKVKELERLKGYQATLLIYESPFRIKDTITALYDVLGNRTVALARELTKRYEEYTRGTLQEMVESIENTTKKGEFCIVVEGSGHELVEDEQKWWQDLSVKGHVTELMERDDLRSKDAIKQVALERDMPKRDVYKMYHIE